MNMAQDSFPKLVREVRRELRSLRRMIRAVSADSPPPGSMMLYPRATMADPPDGWYRTNGQTIDAAADPDLAEMYGATLPNMPDPPADVDPTGNMRWIIRAG